MFIDQFEYDHKKYGCVSVEISECYNEETNQDEIQAWAIYFKNDKECNVIISYPKENKLTKTQIKSKLNKKII